jgi:DNA repair exonuclease SbcCD nuclease subunit
LRFLHTADLQLGLKLRFVPADAGARLRAQRFDTLRSLGGVAREKGAEAVVIAGDLLDDNGVGPDTLQLAADALASLAPLPVLVLPGNHDAADEHSALARLDSADHVQVLDRREPVAVGDALFFPCPLLRRHETRDPTDWLPAREPGDRRVRVAVAHGGVLDFGESTEAPNLIDATTVLERGYDYLALGDWHGLFRYGDRVWYPGTPEGTHWREKQPGHVLLVDIPAAGATPVVEPVPIGRSRWVRREVVFEHDEDVAQLASWLEGLEEKGWTLAQLALEGHLSLSARAELDDLLDGYGGRLACLQVSRDQVRAAPTEEDLSRLSLEGFVGAALGALREDASLEAQDALRLLYRLYREVEGGACT